MDSKVSYGRRGHAGSGVAWIAKCRTRGFLWAGKRCDSRVAVPRRGVRQLAIHATAESPWRAVAGFPSFPSCFNGSQPGAHSPRGRTIDGVECGTPTPPIRVLRPSVFWSPTGAGDGLVRAGFRCTICCSHWSTSALLFLMFCRPLWPACLGLLTCSRRCRSCRSIRTPEPATNCLPTSAQRSVPVAVSTAVPRPMRGCVRTQRRVSWFTLILRLRTWRIWSPDTRSRSVFPRRLQTRPRRLSRGLSTPVPPGRESPCAVSSTTWESASPCTRIGSPCWHGTAMG